MIADPKLKSHRNDRDRRRREEQALDEALKDTFPASDPISIEQPAPGEPPEGDREDKP
jgi:nicotinate phosphoribosyltransferase